MVSQVASSSEPHSSVPEITGAGFAALQMRQHPLFSVMTSSLMSEWDLKGAGSERGGFCTAGMLPDYSPRWPCAQLFLWQTWSKCSDDKIVHFFLHSISSLQWQSHLFPPQAGSWWMSRTRLHRHSHHMWNIKCVNVKVLGIRISSAWCQRRYAMQSVMVGLCTEKHSARTAPTWHLLSQCFGSAAFPLMHAMLQSYGACCSLFI